MDACKEIVELVLSQTSCDVTAVPYWFIAIHTARGPFMVSSGFWFSREAAQKHMGARRYWYPKKAFVYCASGNETAVGGLADLYHLARKAKAQLESQARAILEAKAADRLSLTTPVATTKPAPDGLDRATIARVSEALSPGTFSEGD